MSHRLTQEEFNTRSTLSQSGIYSYVNSKYVGRLVEVEIYCTKHDHTFWQPAGLHMDGVTSCHQCILERKMATRVAKCKSSVPDGHKKCNTCGGVLEKSCFVPNARGIDGLYSVCRTCCAKRGAKDRSCPDYRKRAKTRNREYARINRDRWNAKTARRRAARVRATVDFGDKEFEDFFMQEIYNLAVVRELATGLKWEVDHMAPLICDYVCGLHWSGNLQLLTAFENRSKSNNHWPNMW